MKLNQADILSFDHVGIRVTDRDVSRAFYEKFGFVETAYFQADQANEMETPSGVRINLIMNGARFINNTGRPHNVLLDEPIKLPGITHLAMVVKDLATLQTWLQANKIPITEGPVQLSPRRITLFIRDPDGNVLEFNQLI
jgi:lactoylglutathione lyase